MLRSISAAVICACAALSSAAIAQAIPSFRPPAVPLVTTDPYFSIWSFDETLTAKPTTHWTGKDNRLASLIRIDGTAYRLMGVSPREITALKQISVTMQPTQSIYVFEEHGVQVTLTFTTPLLPDDLAVLARPVTYVTWSVKSTDGQSHEAAVYFDAAAEIAVDKQDQKTIAARTTVGAKRVALSVGTEEQDILSGSGDDRRIDWGHLYVAADEGETAASIAPRDEARKAFAAGQEFPADVASTAVAAHDAPVLAFTLPLGKIGERGITRHITLAYDDEISVKYFHEDLKPFWRKDGAKAADLLDIAEKDYANLIERCDKFDKELIADLTKSGGESYAQIGVLAWRQALAAQKIVADDNGQPLSFSKENNSNGCMSTVDVLYPASPQMMVFAPSLLKASLVPLLDYSASPLWKFKSAPHDLGQYPLAVGNVYGDGDKDAPMPVEETGNMLLMLTALSKVEGNAQFAEKYWPVLTTWYEYLKANGLDPTNQLTTDDFAGHIARNSNLSGKAIVAIAGYGQMANMLGKKDVAADAHKTAKEYALKWMEMGADGDHYGLVFGDKGKGTWSQKYNLVWDKLLGLDVFPKEVVDKEMAFYKTKMNPYGLPLDSRKAYSKLDWQYWTGTMGTDEDFRAISDAAAKWANMAPDRIPMTDWYYTDSGKQAGFKARSVVGGVFIGLMRDKAVWTKYAERDTLKPKNWAAIPWQSPPSVELVATSQKEPQTWTYTTDKPADGWNKPEFDDKAWKVGEGAFGQQRNKNANIHTPWTTPDIYLRRAFTLPAGDLHDVMIKIQHDDGAEIYINGELAKRAEGANNRYAEHKLSKSVRATLKPGKNIIAVHCQDTGGEQYIDVGLVDILPMPQSTPKKD